ncbi:hypothetical protein [Halopiger xanaduensis]|uniref:Uncharacterized protein n=1 Tax=Halopiger xanaduensis (strain DSM 18323 / JCM 14033 / SH-6) TaxID=797210 RepID=F8DD38_HALXS|nr:hypothetical protein [Halopiger xanaduensis]AEH38925.1 hypothetical protein Halxa_0322 [Halopiger xanaduensis SH-6]
MPSLRRQRFIYAHFAWLLSVVLLLTVLDSLTYDLLFLFSLIGFLVVTELTAPVSVTPRWRQRLIWPIVLGLIGFTVLVVRRIVAILPPEVLPV